MEILVKIKQINEVKLDMDIVVTNLESGLIEISQACFGPTLRDNILIRKEEVPELIAALQKIIK